MTIGVSVQDYCRNFERSLAHSDALNIVPAEAMYRFGAANRSSPTGAWPYCIPRNSVTAVLFGAGCPMTIPACTDLTLDSAVHDPVTANDTR